jgi:hypothetical protein
MEVFPRYECVEQYPLILTVPQGDLQAQIEAALQECDAIILVIKAQANAADDSRLSTYMDYLGRFALLTKKPLIVVGTHSDWIRTANYWTAEAENAIHEALSLKKHKDESLVVCSPLLYRSARVIENILRQSSTIPSFDTLAKDDGELVRPC